MNGRRLSSDSGALAAIHRRTAASLRVQAEGLVKQADGLLQQADLEEALATELEGNTQGATLLSGGVGGVAQRRRLFRQVAPNESEATRAYGRALSKPDDDIDEAPPSCRGPRRCRTQLADVSPTSDPAAPDAARSSAVSAPSVTSFVGAKDVMRALGCSRSAAYDHLRRAGAAPRQGGLLRIPLDRWERYANLHFGEGDDGCTSGNAARSGTPRSTSTGRATSDSTGCTEKAAARAVLANWEREAADPDRAASSATLNDALMLLLEDRQARVANGNGSSETVTFYKKKAGHLVRVLGHDFRIALLKDAAPVWRYIDTRRSEGMLDTSIEREITTLRAALRLAKERGLWKGDVDGIIPETFDPTYKPKGRSPTRDEVLRLLPKLLPDAAAAVAFILATSAEDAGLQRALRDDIPEDLDSADVRIHVRGSKNDRRDRKVPIVTDEQRLLIAYAKKHAQGRDGKLFRSLGNLRHELLAGARKAGIAPLSPHALRKAAGQWLIDLGMPLELRLARARPRRHAHHRDGLRPRQGRGRHRPDARRDRPPLREEGAPGAREAEGRRDAQEAARAEDLARALRGRWGRAEPRRVGGGVGHLQDHALPPRRDVRHGDGRCPGPGEGDEGQAPPSALDRQEACRAAVADCRSSPRRRALRGCRSRSVRTFRLPHGCRRRIGKIGRIGRFGRPLHPPRPSRSAENPAAFGAQGRNRTADTGIFNRR